MDPALKQRLVGATVLVALGVIFIPMLLERGSDDARLSVKMEIPPQPDVDFVEPKAPAAKPIKPLKPYKEAVEAVKPKKKPVIPSKPAKPAPKVAAKPSAPSVSAKPKTAEKKPKKTAAKLEAKQWIVQVGSFSRQVNADVLKDKLKSAGFAAFVESAKTGTGPVYRVRIGPVKDRHSAEVIVKTLDMKGGYRGIVMSYSK